MLKDCWEMNSFLAALVKFNSSAATRKYSRFKKLIMGLSSQIEWFV